jgi:hypothetical protein
MRTTDRERGDLARIVRDVRVGQTLLQLRREGVHFAVDEYKVRKPLQPSS